MTYFHFETNRAFLYSPEKFVGSILFESHHARALCSCGEARVCMYTNSLQPFLKYISMYKNSSKPFLKYVGAPMYVHITAQSHSFSLRKWRAASNVVNAMAQEGATFNLRACEQLERAFCRWYTMRVRIWMVDGGSHTSAAAGQPKVLGSPGTK